MDLHTRIAVALALIAILFPSAFTAPAVPQSCSPTCRRNQDPKLQYQEGKSYVYAFDTEVVTQVEGSSDETSRIKVKGQAILAAQSSCDFVLTLQQVAIQSPSGQAISKIDDIEGSSVRFAYQDGVIENICISDSDSTWSANIKRAVVSLLSNKADKITGDAETIEVDISGRCPTTYKFAGNKYTKTKDLNSCTHRSGGLSIVQGVPYEVSSKLNSAPFVKSVLTCEQTVSNGVFQIVSCVEDHKLAALAQKSGVVHTTVKSTLNLVSTQDGSLGAKANVPTVPSTIFYDYAEVEEVQRQKSSASNAVELLNKICSEIESGTVSSKVPGLFLQLKKAVKYSRKEDLKLIHEKITNGGVCQNAREQLEKLYLDAAAFAGTDGSIAFVADVIAEKKVSEETRATFVVYATFANHPGVKSLEALEKLISQSQFNTEFLLTASGLAHQYCRNTNPKCLSVSEYVSLVNKIAQNVRVVSDEKEVEQVIAALQALGNVDQLTPEAASAIIRLLDDDSVASRLKIRALDAFRRDPCQEQLKSKALKKFADHTITSEVRIQAYLALARCVHQRDIDGIQNILNVEKSNQVGAFVESHIKSVLKSVSPSNKILKSAFKQLKLPTPQKFDPRIYSRHDEVSFFSDPLNLGFSGEGNLIFSQDSFVPRTLSGNLTIDAFGRSYNVLEIGGYSEGYEQVIERFFGPKGEGKQRFNEIVAEAKNRWSSFAGNLRNRLRREARTDVDQNAIQDIQSKVNIDPNYKKDPTTDIYLRVLGTTILAESSNTPQRNSMSVHLLRGMEKLVQGAKEHKCDLTEPILFLDDEIILPTIAGLPLNLQIEGTSVLSLQMQGNFDLNALVRGEASDMKAKIMPSAATLLKAKMTVGNGPIESGIQLEGKIHTASGVDLKINREKGKVEVRFNIPQDRIQIIDVRSDLYWVEQAGDHLEKKTPMKSTIPQRVIVDGECTTTLSKALGLKLCADVKAPQLSSNAFPFLSGSSVLSLSIEKVEQSMEGYYLKLAANTEDADNFELDLILDTPGSRTNRKISATAKYLNYRSNTPAVKFELDSPFKKLTVDYLRSNTEALKGTRVKIVNDGEEYTGKVELKRTDLGDKFEFEPLVQYSLPSGSPVNLLEGKVTRDFTNNRVAVDLRTGGSIRSLRGKLSGSLQVDTYLLIVKDLKLESDILGKLSLDGKLDGSKNVRVFDFTSKYGVDTQHQFSLQGKYGLPAQGKGVLQIKSRSSRRTFLNFDLDSEYTRTDNSWENSFKYTRGLEEASKVVISQQAKVVIDSYKKFDLHNELRVVHPDLHIDLDLRTDAKSEPEVERKANIVLKAGSLNAVAKYSTGGTDLSDYSLKADAQFAGKTYEFSEVSTKKSPELRSFKTRIAVSPGFWYEADTSLSHKYQTDDLKSQLLIEVTSDQLSHPVILKTGVLAKKENYGSLFRIDAKGENYIHLENQYKASKSGKPTVINGKAFLKHYLDATLAQTVARPASDLKLKAKWIPTGRVISVESDLKNQGTEYTLNADVKWDAERDTSKAASLHSTNTIVDTAGLKIESKNEVTILGDKTGLNLKGQIPKDLLNGEHSVEVNVKTNAGKTYAVTASNNLEKHSKSQSSKLHLKVELPETEPYELDWENKIANVDTKECTFEILSNLKLKYKGAKNLNLHTEVRSLIPGNYRTFSGQFEASGNAIAQPVGFDIKTDVKTGHVEVVASGKRGARKGDIEVKIDLHRFTPKKRLQIDYKLNTPFPTLKSVVGSYKFGFFFESWKNFDISEVGSVKLNENPKYNWETTAIVLENELKSVYNVLEGGEPLIQLKASGKRVGKKISGSASSVVRGQKSEVNVEADYEFPTVDFKISGQTPVETLKKFELKLGHKSNDGGSSYDTEVIAKINDNRAKLTNKLELLSDRHSIDLTISLQDQPSRTLYLALVETERDTWTIEGRSRWGDGGKFVNSVGKLINKGEIVDVTMDVDSPAWNVKKWSIRATKKLVSGRHSVALSAESDSKKIGALSVDYAKKVERSGDQNTYDGSVKIEARAISFDGNFRVEDTKLDKQRDNGEEGRKISGNINLSSDQSPLRFTFLAKRSNLERRLQASFCNEEDDECKVGDLHLRHERKENGDLDYKFKAAVETKNNGQQSDINAIVIKTVRTENGRQFENSAQLILGKEKQHPIGYKLYRKDGKETGAEILLPQRIIAAVLVSERKGDSELKTDLSFYVDKTKQPNRKISVVFDAIRKVSSESNKEVKASLVFHHPDVSKDMKISTNYVYSRAAETVFDGKVVLDVFEANKEITFGYKMDMKHLASGWEARSLGSIVSKGQHINIVSKGEFSQTDNEISYRSEIKYENRHRQIKSSKIDASLSKNRIHIQVSGSESKVLSVTANWEKHATGYEVRQEIQLPGMEDARIFHSKVSTVSPHHVEWKTYTTSSSPGQFYEAYLGFKNEKHIVIGLYDHETEGKNVLADLNVALNTSRVLFVKTNWDLQNIKNVVTKAQNRLEKTTQKLKELSLTSGKETVDEVKHLISSLKTATPNLKAVCDSYKKQMTDLKTELEADEDTRQLIDYFDFVSEIAKEHVAVLREISKGLKKSIVQLLDELKTQAENLPAIWAQILDKLPVTVEAFKDGVDSALESLAEACKLVTVAVWDTIERISANSPAIAEKLTWLADASIEISKFIQKGLIITVDKLSRVWTVLKESTNDILENPTVKEFVKELIVRYKRVLAEMIKDAKEQAEEFRKYILTVLPGQEIQELVETIAEYVEKKARQTPVDDVAAQKEIYNKLVAAVKKVVNDIFTIDLDHGLFIAQLPLPKNVDNLTDIGKLVGAEWGKIHRPAVSMLQVPSLNYGFQEVVNKIKSAQALYNKQGVLPPFRAMGLVIGSQYYKTFDGKFYHFEGNCQYLLASDFIDRNFSVVLDYDNTGRQVEKSLIFTYEDSTAGLKQDHTVVIDGQPSKSSGEWSKHGKFLIWRKPQYTVLIADQGAVTVGCSTVADVCIVTVNGYFQGKTAGLLGTYNNEQFDDLRTPSGKLEENVEKFTSEWKVDKQCREPAIPAHSAVTSDAKRQCANAFEWRRSTFAKSCYGIIDSSPFINICEHLTTEKGYDTKKAICTAAEAYAKPCFLNGVSLDVSSVC